MPDLNFLFPIPSLPTSTFSPAHFPGISSQSTDTLLAVLKDNHEKWHIFFNEQRFHNHAPHRSIALWALGADSSTIRQKYEKDCNYEKPSKASPKSITLQNFNQHLGDDDYYTGYCRFFAEYIEAHGIPATLERFLFSADFNLSSTPNTTKPPFDTQPQMLNRFLTGVLHPVIHTGYGVEFGLPGMVVEGLGESAVHRSSADLLGPLHLFSEPLPSAAKQTLAHAGAAIESAFNLTVDKFDSALERVLPQPLHDVEGLVSLQNPSSKGVPDVAENVEKGKRVEPRAIDILLKLMQDERVQIPPLEVREGNGLYDWTIEHNAQIIALTIGDWGWSVARGSESTGGNKKGLEAGEKCEEIIWVVALLYGIGGWTSRTDKGLNADFFFMHLVTSSVFLPSYLALLTPLSGAKLLRAYLSTVLAWYIARGCPSLDVRGFYEAGITLPPSLNDPTPIQNPEIMKANQYWYAILTSATQHPDEHLTKTQRSLLHWATVLGAKRIHVFIDKAPSREPESAKGMGNLKAQAPLSHEDVLIAEGIAERETKGNLFEGSVGSQKPTDVTKTGDADDVLGDHHEGRPGNREAVDKQIEPRTFTSTTSTGSHVLDGSVFLRTALLTARRMGWVGFPGQKEGDFWDFSGFFPDSHDETEIGRKPRL